MTSVKTGVTPMKTSALTANSFSTTSPKFSFSFLTFSRTNLANQPASLFDNCRINAGTRFGGVDSRSSNKSSIWSGMLSVTNR